MAGIAPRTVCTWAEPFSLVERSRLGGFNLAKFQAEADAYWPNGVGGSIKPDAFIRLEREGAADFWWYEADLATESLPTVHGKLLAYLDFVQRGQLGPDGVVPRVLIGVPTSKRRTAVQSLWTICLSLRMNCFLSPRWRRLRKS